MAQERPLKTDTVIFENVTFSFRDVSTVINAFYTKVQTDPVLIVPFQTVKDWSHHIERLTNFWWIRLGGTRYLNAKYNPVLKHLEAGFNQEFLARWLNLFKETLELHLTTEQQKIWRDLSEMMGNHLSRANDMYRVQNTLF